MSETQQSGSQEQGFTNNYSELDLTQAEAQGRDPYEVRLSGVRQGLEAANSLGDSNLAEIKQEHIARLEAKADRAGNASAQSFINGEVYKSRLDRGDVSERELQARQRNMRAAGITEPAEVLPLVRPEASAEQEKAA